MPHECTNCGHVFPDGSKEMLSGCPDCGGKKFQFKPSRDRAAKSAAASSEESATAGEGSPAASDEGSATASAEPSAAAGGQSKAEQLLDESDDREDVAQASARSEVAGEEDIAKGAPAAADDPEAEAPDMAALRSQLDDAEAQVEADSADAGTDSGGLVGSPVENSDPDAVEMEEIRQELNAQFESIKVLAPGQYELNLMDLYEREEYIIALQQNGRYVIEVPNGWDDDE